MVLVYRVLFVLVTITVMTNGLQEYGMDQNCDRDQVIRTDSAIVRSQATNKYYIHGVNCTRHFQATRQRFFIQVQSMDIYKGLYGNCSEDYLSISELRSDGSEHKLLDHVCGSHSDLPKRSFKSQGELVIHWVTIDNSTAQQSHVGFRMMLTSYSDSPDGGCEPRSILCPVKGWCIPKSLMCDGFPHCTDGYDEGSAYCVKSTPAAPPAPSLRSTVVDPTSSVSESETFWFIAMLGIIVISILGAIAAVVRRKHIERRQRLTSSQTDEPEDTPTYNRQESALSTGSAMNNVESPPEYDIALTCSSEPLPPSYSEVDFENSDMNGNRSSSNLFPDSPFFSLGNTSPGANSVFILEPVVEEAQTITGKNNSNQDAPASRTNTQTTYLCIPSDGTASDDDELTSERL